MVPAYEGEVQFLAITDEGTATAEAFRDAYGLEMPLYANGGDVHRMYQQELPFATGAYPQQWIVGTDGRIVYMNNRLEIDSIHEVLDAQLGR